MSALSQLLDTYRAMSQTEREKGTYFERLVVRYFEAEPRYQSLYDAVWMYADWAQTVGRLGKDSGIDLVARTRTGELHAIQCKLWAPDRTVQKSDIDSFLNESGKKPFTQSIVVSTTDLWSDPAKKSLEDRQVPAYAIFLRDLEASRIDWSQYQPSAPAPLRAKKALLPHQQAAVRDVLAGLASADRGKLIMACGTGKTFTSLKIAEAIAKPGGRVLFLVPSLSLLSQALTEWTQESAIPLYSFAVCSDSDVGKRRDREADLVPTLTHELPYPATTSAATLAKNVAKLHDAAHLTVVFSTYHSIDVVSRAQKENGLGAFDLIVCDEAHRTTGAVFEDAEESTFVKVHDGDFLAAKKRLYMTATPRIYGEGAKATAERDSIALCSMDDPALYGEELHVISFSRAVQLGLLADYKVIVLAVEESHVNRRLQTYFGGEEKQLKVDDAARIVGCWKALAKQGLTADLHDDLSPMRRAVAFCQVIAPSTSGRTHKVSSLHIADVFEEVVEAYRASAPAEEAAQAARLRCEAAHVDGGMGAIEKARKLDWLKEEPPEDTCRVLSNVRCLSEGVDVPALDAVLFLTPRNSQVDVVQSVGRVMRKPRGGTKTRGYVVLPVVIPAGIEPHVALADNKTYAVVWQVLQALRSHDDRFDAMINKMELDLNHHILEKMEVVAVTDRVTARPRSQSPAGAHGTVIGTAARPANKMAAEDPQLAFEIGDIERAIYARVVKKCGNRQHWEEWANDIAKIARTHIDRIEALLEDPAQTRARAAFDAFATELRDDLNDNVTDGEVVEMLAQHLITKPVFDALFAEFPFASKNPISRAMGDVLEVLKEQRLDKEADTLEQFYASVRQRAEGVGSASGKQKIVVELYDKFFRNAFPKMSERLGIVYTPVELVDFILHSVDHLLKTEFGQTLGSEGVHILDPFTGTGTFITRLLQSGLIDEAALPRKYAKEIHANEIVLLAYYIAAINIEATYHSIVGGDYAPFEGICLTDTFQLYEKDDLIARALVDNSTRRARQKKLDIRVIIGNPPYSVGQDSQNDNNQNVAYPSLDERIAKTYAARSSATLSKGLYDSYVRSIRWASDRVGQSGIVGFVTNANFVGTGTFDGLRRCLVEEFSSLYVFHLRGDQRTAGEVSKREGGKIFGSGSRAPVAISLLVKNPNAKTHGQIYFRDVGDYLSREQKLEAVARFGSVVGISNGKAWTAITPDEHGDWLRQRDTSFARHLAIGIKDNDNDAVRLFALYSLGLVTNRDAWAYSSSKAVLSDQMTRMIAFYNAEASRFDATHPGLQKRARASLVDAFVDADSVKIAWTRGLKNELAKGSRLAFNAAQIVPSLYRPFTKQWLYFDRKLNEMVLQVPRLFPEPTVKNRAIGVAASGSRQAFSALMADVLPNLNAVDMGGSQFFPLYVYDADDSGSEGEETLFTKAKGSPTGSARRDGITDGGLAHFQAAYPGEAIGKEDVFYYVYGLLHSADYRERYADNLGKELPRIPCVKSAADFWAFSRAGRALGDLHVGYEQALPYPAAIEVRHPAFAGFDKARAPAASPLTLPIGGAVAADAAPVYDAGSGAGPGTGLPDLPPALFRVEKMRYGKASASGAGKAGPDKTTLVYNEHITVRGIPLGAYDYVVNGKAALDWVVERQGVKVDKDSGIVNDANLWATETMGNARYPLELFLRVVTVSLKTLEIVRGLPALAL